MSRDICTCLLSTRGWRHYVIMTLERPCDARWHVCATSVADPQSSPWFIPTLLETWSKLIWDERQQKTIVIFDILMNEVLKLNVLEMWHLQRWCNTRISIESAEQDTKGMLIDPWEATLIVNLRLQKLKRSSSASPWNYNHLRFRSIGQNVKQCRLRNSDLYSSWDAWLWGIQALYRPPLRRGCWSQG